MYFGANLNAQNIICSKITFLFEIIYIYLLKWRYFKYNQTPLHIAIINKQQEMIKFLLQQHAKTDIKDKEEFYYN